MLNLRQIEVFRAVMISKSVSGAARMLNTSQPGVSRMLKHMEARLGFALFDRVAGRLIPTQEAERIFSEIQTVYEVIGGMDKLVRRLASGDSIDFRLGASPSLSNHLVPIILRQLIERFPKLEVAFDTLPVDQIPAYLVRERGEYALSVFPVDHPNVESRKLGEGNILCVMPAGHRLCSKGTITAADLRGERLIGLPPESPHGRLIGEFFRSSREVLHPTVIVRFAETACAMARQGLGIAFADEFTFGGFQSPAITALPLDRPCRIPVFINRGRFAPQSRVGKAFEALATASFISSQDI